MNTKNIEKGYLSRGLLVLRKFQMFLLGYTFAWNNFILWCYRQRIPDMNETDFYDWLSLEIAFVGWPLEKLWDVIYLKFIYKFRHWLKRKRISLISLLVALRLQ